MEDLIQANLILQAKYDQVSQENLKLRNALAEAESTIKELRQSQTMNQEMPKFDQAVIKQLQEQIRAQHQIIDSYTVRQNEYLIKPDESFNQLIPVPPFDRRTQQACLKDQAILFENEILQIITITSTQNETINLTVKYHNKSSRPLIFDHIVHQTQGLNLVQEPLTSKSIQANQTIQFTIQAQASQINYELPILQIKYDTYTSFIHLPLSLNKFFQSNSENIQLTNSTILANDLQNYPSQFTFFGHIMRITLENDKYHLQSNSEIADFPMVLNKLYKKI